MSPEELDPEKAEELLKVLAGPENFGELMDFIVNVWLNGGWVMIPLFMLTCYLYFEAMSVMSQLGKTKAKKVPPNVWAKWFYDPSKGKGFIGDVIRYVLAGGINEEPIINRLATLRQQFLPQINQRIMMLTTMVAAAPLMGLLGTVIGMLQTFKGLAASASQSVDIVAEGIHVALITTQTGLMIAIPGYIFISQIIRKRNEYVGFLAQLESLAIQECSKHNKTASHNNEEV